MNKSPLIVSLYTKATYYEEEIKGLISSCEKLGINHYIEGVPSVGSWNDNCHLKPFFIRSMVEKHRCPILWIDADALVFKPLDYFNSIEEDIAVRVLEYLPEDHQSRVISATVFINDTQEALLCVNRWCYYSKLLRESHNDQACLSRAISEKPERWTTRPLPSIYCAMDGFPLDQHLDKSIVIGQTQASRLYRKILDGEIEEFPFLKDMDEKSLKALRRSYN